MGGCLLLDKLAWGSTMFSLNAAPPDPALVGERWREMWMERLERERLLARGLAGATSAATSSTSMARSARTMTPSTARSMPSAAGPMATPTPIFRLLANLQRPAQGAGRPLGAQISAFRQARPADRLPAGMPALVGPLAEGHRDRHHGRADAARLDGETRSGPRAYNRGEARALGGGSAMAAGRRRSSWRLPLSPGGLVTAGDDVLSDFDRRRPRAWRRANGAPMASWADQPLDQRAEMGGQLVFDTRAVGGRY